MKKLFITIALMATMSMTAVAQSAEQTVKFEYASLEHIPTLVGHASWLLRTGASYENVYPKGEEKWKENNSMLHLCLNRLAEQGWEPVFSYSIQDGAVSTAQTSRVLLRRVRPVEQPREAGEI